MYTNDFISEFCCGGGWAVVVQSLPTIATLNSSLYVVYAGYQDYFFSLYESVLTPQETLQLVDPVVQAIVDLIEVSTVPKSIDLQGIIKFLFACKLHVVTDKLEFYI